ncbi:MAG: LLM class F420-dependent oxidoreductase [Mycobacterium sp.]
MRVGVTFPQTELGGDPGAVRAYGESVEDLGFSHILVYDHVVGADPAVHRGWTGPYDVNTTFHEPFVMYGYLAAVTRSLELVTGVIILPQRQTTLVAKQAAEVDLLSGGRLRLGIGVGWNAVEYEALGEEFGNRGKRSAEQIELLRRLWTEQTVTFDGEFHTVTGAGIAPLPVQRPIPVWVGAASPPGYKRAGRLADGWFPMMGPGQPLDDARGVVESAAVEAGRDPTTIGMEGSVDWRGDVYAVADHLAAWAKSGASHVSVNTMGAGLQTVDDHLAALSQVAETLSAQ